MNLVLVYLFIICCCCDSRTTTPEPVTRSPASIPPTLTVSGSANKGRSNGTPRKNPPVQRSLTGGLEGEQPRTPSPTKSKLNFLEGFRNTLRARSPVRTNSIPVSTKFLTQHFFFFLRTGHLRVNFCSVFNDTLFVFVK